MALSEALCGELRIGSGIGFKHKYFYNVSCIYADLIAFPARCKKSEEIKEIEKQKVGSIMKKICLPIQTQA
ncbi:MAG: hypothetical protein RIF39_02570 [Cyclobacteriaceae bacterium]